MSKKEALQKVKVLIEDFQRNKEFHTSKEFLENHCEENFVKPFIKVLGWDIESRGIAPYLREVITQDRVTHKKTKRAPDYGFRLPGSDTRLFYLEAKGAFVKLKTDKDAAHQARWYGRSGKTPVTLLFNFAELAVYDCTQKQTSTSDAKFARIKYFTCDEYVENFDFIYDTFSREAIYNGNFQNFIKDKTQKKGNVTLDKDFVESLEKWRKSLAQSIAKNNLKINDEELNHAVQLLLDRLIFLRFCEERDVEPFGQLQAVANHSNIYKHLFELFYIADKKYNSGLFHFENGCVTEKLKLEDKVIKGIIEDLYPPKSDYAFSIMPVEILGNAYEQFLGKVIRITSGHNIRIEEKPEVRKAGGVYYTPQYVVDYIVEQTIGKLIEGKSPKEIEKIKIVDPACGSGSFLLGAYKYLLNYHQNYYFKKSSKSKELNEDGTLTTAEKRKILTNNIFGVDLDENAVEVSKLSVLLKCMEGETASSVKQQITMHHTRVLPDLDKNIVKGNSLIGYDFTDGELELDKEEKEEIRRHIKPFDWKVTFPHVFRQGKFDAVIGNPPYVNLVNIEPTQRDYFQKTFKTCKNKSDLYSFFIEKSLDLIKSEESKFGFIIPHTWLATESFELFRKLLIDKGLIEEIVEMGFKVFQDAIVSTVVLICSNGNSSITVKNREFSERVKIPYKVIKANNYIIDLDWSLSKQKLYDKIEEKTIPLEKIISFSRGIKTSDDNRFLFPSKKNNDCFKIYRGRNIKAYQLNWEKEWVWYRPDLMKEKVGSLSHSKEFFEVPEKLVTQRVNSSMQLLVAYDDSKNYFLDTVNVSRYDSWDKKHSMKFVCGLLNSKLINYWYCNKYKMPTIGLYELHSVPVKPIDFQNKNEKKIYDDIIKLVDLLINKNRETKSITQAKEVEEHKNKIDYNLSKIDDLVYQLYNLSSDEIRIVEQSNESD